MPTLHIASLTASLATEEGRWWVTLSHGQDSHWNQGESALEYVLQYAEYGDTVEFRLPDQITWGAYTFDITAETAAVSGPPTAWSESNNLVCSPTYSAVSQKYFDVYATPVGTPPSGFPTGGPARGGGHYHVKNSGGDGKRQ